MSAAQEKRYWFVSVPKSYQFGFAEVKSRLERSGWASCAPFVLPELRIGTLDTLMSLSDELAKHDNFVGNVCGKLAKQLVELQVDDEGDNDNNNQNFSVQLDDVLTVGQANIDPYLKKFKWNIGRWDYEKSSLQYITEDIVKTASAVDATLRQQAAEWQTVNRSISAAQAVSSGNVLLRDLSNVVQKEHILDTESLATLLVVVPKSTAQTWWDNYEALEDDGLAAMMQQDPKAAGGRFVVPGSSQVLAEDSDNLLVNVTILRKFIDAFKAKMRDMRFTVRDFQFAQEEEGVDKEQGLRNLVDARKQLKVKLFAYCKTQFADIFSCWVHLKSIRVWVESVLRYSLPATFDVVLIKPEQKFNDKIRKTLADMFRGLVSEGLLGGPADLGDGEALLNQFAQEEMFPYVFAELALSVRT